MSINLGEVFTTFATKYDKQNILSYAGVLFFLSLLCAFVGVSSLTGTIICMIVYIIATTIYIGYYAVTSNNEANNIKNAFPSINDLGNIIKEGIKYSLGMFSLSIIVYVLPFAIMGCLIFYSIKEGLAATSILTSFFWFLLLLLLIILLGYFIVLPLQIIYLKSLNFNDFFAFDKIKEFKARKGNQFLTFFLFSIIVNIAISVVASTLSVTTLIAGGIAKIGNIDIYAQLFNFFITMVLYNLLLPNLNGQIARYDVSKDPNIYDDEYEEDV